ncbi:MAG: YcxB family protein [Cyanobacteria bacterium J06560_6]
MSKLKYTLSPNDLSCLGLYEYQHSPIEKRRRVIFSILGVFVIVYGMVMLYIGIPLLAMFMVAAGTLLLLRPYRIKRALRKRAIDPEIQDIFGEYELILNAEGIQCITPVSNSTMKWQIVKDIVHHDHYFFIRLCTGRAFVINCRTYSGDVPVSDIPQVVNSYLTHSRSQ